MPTAPVRGLISLPVHRAFSTSTNLRLASAFSPSCLAIIQSAALRGDGRAVVKAPQRRLIHSSEKRTNTIAELPGTAYPIPSPAEPKNAPLSVLPLQMILRSLGTTLISSSPMLLGPSLKLMAMLAHSSNPILNPDSNPILRFFLKNTFYAQFCAGENAAEVRATISNLKKIGFNGVILGYAKEVVLPENDAQSMASAAVGIETPEIIENEINPWTHGTLETVSLAEPGDFVALKFTGAGRLALHQLAHNDAPSPYLAECIDAICKLAHERGVRLLFDAEQDALQDGIDNWTIQYSRKYNTKAEEATIYGTYQAYKKATPAVLSKHLAEAQEGNFTVGVKLVRGAYINSDPRDRFFETKEGTDACYNGVAAAVLTRQWGPLIEGKGDFPNAHIVLATHNAESVRRARAIVDGGAAKSDIACAQLQGMADEVSCELVEASQATQPPAVPVYKYLVWGTTGECMKYLLRRAQENKDAVQRTKDGRDAMWAELVRRCKVAVGFA